MSDTNDIDVLRRERNASILENVVLRKKVELLQNGTRGRLVLCGQEAVSALGLDEHNDAPDDVRKAINRLRKERGDFEIMALAAVAKLEEIVCTVEPDRGVVLLSQEGPTHYDKEWFLLCGPGYLLSLKCNVYDHVNFSPLGDALIELHDLLRSLLPTPRKDETDGTR